MLTTRSLRSSSRVGLADPAKSQSQKSNFSRVKSGGCLRFSLPLTATNVFSNSHNGKGGGGRGRVKEGQFTDAMHVQRHMGVAGMQNLSTHVNPYGMAGRMQNLSTHADSYGRYAEPEAEVRCGQCTPVGVVHSTQGPNAISAFFLI